MREWEAVKTEITAEFVKVQEAREARPAKGANAQRFYQGQRQREENALRRERELFGGFLDRLKRFRVLDPACGSGNFLYLGLRALKDIELRANQDHEALSLSYGVQIGVYTPGTGPENMLGIEINPFAVELARVSVWIGEIQWMREHGFDATRNPILKSLDNIACHDALLNDDGSEYAWPAADAIIGNPPFLGAKRILGVLGDRYAEALRSAYEGRVSDNADFVCYWFEKAQTKIDDGSTDRVGLVATNSIRGGASRIVLDRIQESEGIFNAWADEPWMLDGAAVRVSIVCFGNGTQTRHLDGQLVDRINADLSSSTADLTRARRLSENKGACFEGGQKYGSFDVTGEEARRWLQLPLNPNGRPNADVLRPYLNAMDVVRRGNDRWIIDFGSAMNEREAALYEKPFRHVEQNVKQERMGMRREIHRRYWWRHGWVRLAFEAKRKNMKRYIATPVVAKHRLFVWVHSRVFPTNLLDVISREDDTTFGILHSRMHELWSLGLGTWLGVGNDPRYTPSSTFETFPFPDGLAPSVPAESYASDARARGIAAAANLLHELRENWLNPADLVRRVPEVAPDYPDRIQPVDDAAATELKKRTLTNLYNERPAWLDHAHRDLDRAVANAYGWNDWDQGLSNDEILQRLFSLNQERATDRPAV